MGEAQTRLWPFKPLVAGSSPAALISPQIWGFINLTPYIWRFSRGNFRSYLPRPHSDPVLIIILQCTRQNNCLLVNASQRESKLVIHVRQFRIYFDGNHNLKLVRFETLPTQYRHFSHLVILPDSRSCSCDRDLSVFVGKSRLHFVIFSMYVRLCLCQLLVGHL